jgi:hypothetical protein
MKPFPGEHELAELFEVAPIILEPDVPLAYNTLTFTTTRGDDVIRCEIQPGEREIDFEWTQAGRPVFRLRVGGIDGLRVKIDREAEALLATFPEGSRLAELRIQFKPTIRVAWGSTDWTGQVMFTVAVPH